MDFDGFSMDSRPFRRPFRAQPSESRPRDAMARDDEREERGREAERKDKKARIDIHMALDGLIVRCFKRRSPFRVMYIKIIYT